MRRRLPPVFALSLGVGLLLGACAGEAPIIEGPPLVELGTGILQFEPLADNDELEIIQGPQGGFHFIVAMQASGVIAGNPDDLGDAQNPTTRFRAYRASDGERIDIGNANFTQGLDFVTGSNGTFEMIARLVILMITDDQQLAGQSVRLTVEIEDIEGRMASDERMVLGVPHPANP